MSVELSTITLNPDKDALLIIGDSITAANTIYQENTTTKAFWSAFGDFGPETWMQAFLKGKRFRKTHFRARSGIAAYEIVAGSRANWTLSAIVTSSDAGTALIGLGTNDVTAGRTAQQVHDAIEAIGIACENRLMRVCIKSIFARRSDNTDWTTANINTTLRANDLIRKTCYTRGWSYINIAQAMTDYTNTSSWATPTAKLVDGTHPNNFGALKIGKVLADFFANRADFIPANIFHFRDGYAYDSTSNQLIVNPLHQSGWSFATTYGGETITGSTVDSPSGYGKASQLVFSGANTATTGTTAYQSFSSQPLYQAGMSIEAGATMVVDSGVAGVAPTNVICPSFYAGTSAPISGARGGVGAFADTATTGKVAIDQALDLQMITTPMRFSGEETNQEHQMICTMKSLENAAFRVRISDTFIRLGVSPYTLEKPCFWTDSNTPVSVF